MTGLSTRALVPPGGGRAGGGGRGAGGRAAGGRAGGGRAAGAAATRTLISSAQLNRASGKIVYRIVLTLVVVVFTLVFIGPMYFLFSDGLKSTAEAIAVPPTLVPAHVHPATYAQAWNRIGIARLLLNTLYYAFGALAFQLVFDVAAAYALSKLRPALGNVIFAMMLGTLMIPATVLVVPQYLTVASLPILHLNLIGSPAAIWLPSVANAFSIFLLKRFFDSIPRDLMDAAALDGASALQTLRRVVLPISRPILGVVSIFGLVAVWKDFLWPLLVEGGYSPSRETLNVGIYNAVSTTPQNLIIAASAIAAVPTIVFFLIFQRNIMSGLSAGSLKG
jgi:multiple sugar transport system permease protein